MTFKEYQDFVTKSMIHKDSIYPVFGLAGESGEVVEKVKKLYRLYGDKWHKKLSGSDKLDLILELGDTLWYLTRITSLLEEDIEFIAKKNKEKLIKREKERKK